MLYIDEFWLMKEHLSPINETVTELSVMMQYSPIAMWKWQIQVQMEQSLAMQENLGGTQGEGEEFKVCKRSAQPTSYKNLRLYLENVGRNKPIFVGTYFCHFNFAFSF